LSDSNLAKSDDKAFDGLHDPGRTTDIQKFIVWKLWQWGCLGIL